MAAKLIIVRHSGRRQVDESTVLESIDEGLRLGARDTIHVDTQVFAEDVAANQWAGHESYLRDRAVELRRLADAAENPEIHYAGLAEIPHVIAFGAAVGSERTVLVHEFDRDTGSWAWPDDEPVQEVIIERPISGSVVTAAGDVVLRVSISAVVQDADVRVIVGEETLADLTIRYANGTAATTRVRSEAQVVALRAKVREALAQIKNLRPNAEAIHLFVAAPNSVCFVIGQELVPRNMPPIQTYIYRISGTAPAYSPAILITAAPPTGRPAVTLEEDVALAAKLRDSLWTKALNQVRGYSERKKTEENRNPTTLPLWYSKLEPSSELTQIAPFPSLPPVYKLVDPRDRIDALPFYEDYGHDPEQHLWRISDGLVIGMYRAAGQQDDRLLPLLRLFFFHEYVHTYHSLTKYTAANVGKFANALERLDYTADTFAIFNELDFRHYAAVGDGEQPLSPIDELSGQVDQVLRSFWAFDGTGPHDQMQLRRLRRYLNWYWRLTQLRRAPTTLAAVSLFRQSPAVELSGLRLSTDGERRVYAHFQRARAQRLELAIVLENEILLRITDADATSMEELVDAFRRADHERILAWFRPVYEIASRNGAVYGEPHPLVHAHGGDQ